jgi:HSP20 family protein
MFYRRLSTPSAWEEMERLQREMNRLFSDFTPTSGRSVLDFPAVNLWSGDEGAVLTAELPGIDPADLDINVSGSTLTLSGKRQPEKVGDKVVFHRQERAYGQFVRSIDLPFTPDTAKVEALYDKGILLLHLPRAEADQPKKITVKNLK